VTQGQSERKKAPDRKKYNRKGEGENQENVLFSGGGRAYPLLERPIECCRFELQDHLSKCGKPKSELEKNNNNNLLEKSRKEGPRRRKKMINRVLQRRRNRTFSSDIGPNIIIRKTDQRR